VRKNEIIQKNISLSFDFIRHLVRYPDLLESMPDIVDIEFVERDLPLQDPETSASDLGKKVVFSVEHTFREISLE
jgi:hypothetical protein